MTSQHRATVVSRSVNILFDLLILSDVFAGLLRFVCVSIGAPILLYIPKAMVLLLPSLILISDARLNPRFALLLAILLLAVINSLINLPSPYQGIFGLWTILPFIFGFWGSHFILPNAAEKQRFFIIVFFIAAVGVLANTEVSFPWVGTNISIGGTTLVAAKDLSDYGFTRYGGFSLSSFNAATQILAAATWVLVYSRRRLLSVFVWLLCGVAVVVTTTKGLAASYVILSAYFLTSRYLKTSSALRYMWCAVLYFFLILDIYLPLYSISHKTVIRLHSLLEAALVASTGARLSTTWPGTLSLITWPFGWLFGRGIGGVGEAQSIFEQAQEWPADNIFNYLVVSFGLFVSLFFLGWFVKTSCSRLQQSSGSPLNFPFAILLMSYGLVAPIIDWQTLSLIFGVLYASL